MKSLSFFIAATAAATYLFVTAEEASAQGRGRGGGSFAGGSSVGRSFSSGSSFRSSGGSSSFRSSGGSSSRSFSQSSGSSSRSFSSRSSGGSSNRSFSSGNGNSGRSITSNRVTQTTRQTTVQQNSNRVTTTQQTNSRVRNTQTNTTSNANRVTNTNATNNANRVTNTNTTNNPNRVTNTNTANNGNRGINPANGNPNNRVGQGNVTQNGQGQIRNNTTQATNQQRPSILAPNLRSGLGVPLPKGNTSIGNSLARTGHLPVHKAVTGNQVQRARLGLPLNLAPKAQFTKVAVPTHFHSKWRPFVQRHWRSAFFWVALGGIGYVTVPEWGYERFRTYVDRDEPDYQGATAWLNECAVRDEGHEVPRVATPANLVVTKTVAATALPDTQYDERLGRFVNRRWNSPYVWISMPRVGTVTVPQSISEQVQKFMDATPPDMAAALQVMEEAAAADTVVAEAPQVETPSEQQ